MTRTRVITPAGRRPALIIVSFALAAVIAVTVGACGTSTTAPSPTASVTIVPYPTSSVRALGGPSIACPTQSQGGDTLPVVCAPSTSPPDHDGISLPPTDERIPSLRACPDSQVVSVSPDHGSAAGGEAVIIAGRGLGPGTEFFFGGTEAGMIAAVSPTEIRVTAPPGPADGAAVAVTAGCAGTRPSPAAVPVEFTYQASTVTPLTPATPYVTAPSVSRP